VKKYNIFLFVFFLLIIISPALCQQLELVQTSGSGTNYSSEYINFGEVTNHYVATDSDFNYGLTNRFNGNNSVFSWTAWNRTNREYGVRIIEYSPILTFDVTDWFRFTNNRFSIIDTYNYNLSSLPSYTPSIIGHVVAQFVDSNNNIISKEVPVKWGPGHRRFKWGDFNNIQGKYIDYVEIKNITFDIPYYGAKKYYTSKVASFRNTKFISQEIIIDPSYNFLGVRPDGTWGSVSFNPDWHVVIGDETPIILYPGTVLKAVDEDYFESPSSPISQLRISNKQKVMDQIMLYPNPNDGKLLYIQKNRNELVHKIEIYDESKVVYG